MIDSSDIITPELGADCYQDGMRKALTKVFTEYHHDRFMKSPYEYLEFLHTEEKDDLVKWLNVRKKAKRYAYVFIVVNPKPDITLPQIVSRIEKTLKKKWIDSYLYSIEQRSITLKDMGRGIHINFLFELNKDKSPWQCKKEVYNTWKDCVGSVKAVYHAFSNNPTNFINYIQGIKKDKNKKRMVEVDKKWRKSVGLLDFYSSC